MKKKKVKFESIKLGEYFKFCRVVYLKVDICTANRIIGKQKLERYFFCDDMVTQVTVTIKVREKK